MVEADFFECFDKTFAALPVGAIRMDCFPRIGKLLTNDEIKVVLPVPAYPLSMKILLLPSVVTYSAKSVISFSCSLVGE